MERNPNEAVTAAAEELYETINKLELYVGLQVEDTKLVVKSAGLCHSWTVSLPQILPPTTLPPGILPIAGDPGFPPTTDTPERGEGKRRQTFKAFAETPGQAGVINKFFYDNTKAPIAKQSRKPVGDERSALYTVRDIFRVVPIQWVATQVVSDATSPRGFCS